MKRICNKIDHLILNPITTRIVGHIFVLFTSPKHLEASRNLLNCRHVNRMSFFDLQIIREGKISTTSVYRKPTLSEVYAHFDSFLPSTYKYSTVYTLAYRCLRICSSWIKSHNELVCLEEIFLKNGYLEDFINKCFKKFMDTLIQYPCKLGLS